MSQEKEIKRLEREINLLKARQKSTWLTSSSFLKRAFGVLGHLIVAYILIAIPIVIIMAIIGA